MSTNPQHFEELELVAEKTGELNDRVGKIEGELGAQTKTLESAAMVLDAAIKGLGALKSQVLENDIGALQLALNDKTEHLAREIGRFESAVAEIDRRSEAGDEQLNAALRDTALGLRESFNKKSAEIAEWSARVEREIAAHSVALAAIPPVIKGADAKTFNPRGEWQSGMIVNALDVVSYNGSSYISNLDGNTDKPTKSEKYTTLAKRSGNGAGGATDFASLTGIASPSQIASGTTTYQVGDLLYANSTGTLAPLHPGTSGQILMSNGAGAAPSYFTATGGAGDVNGPASSTDNAIARFDSTGGKIIQNSTVTLSDAGVLSVASTTPSTGVGTGALQVAGGIYAGAASVFAGSVTSTGQLIGKGTATNDNAATGYIGEYVSSTVGYASRISISNGTSANITSISLTAGDWDVTAICGYKPTATTTRRTLYAASSSVSATAPDTDSGAYTAIPFGDTTDANAKAAVLTGPSTRYSIASTTTIYLIAYAEFGASTMEAFGTIRARRVR